MRARIRHTVRHTQTKKDNTALENAMLVVAIAEPLMTLPQIIDIYSQHTAQISMLTWILYALASIMWLIYGAYRRSLPLIVTGGIWIIMEALVIYGILKYS